MSNYLSLTIIGLCYEFVLAHLAGVILTPSCVLSYITLLIK